MLIMFRFLVLSSGIIYGYYAHILKIDDEEYGGHATLLQEGLFASFTLFLVKSLIYSPLSVVREIIHHTTYRPAHVLLDSSGSDILWS